MQVHPAPDAVGLVAPHLNDPDNATRFAAASALRVLATGDVTGVMLKALKHSDAVVRQQAALYFVTFPNPLAEPLLISELQDIDTTVRANAVEKIDRPDARSALVALRTLESPPVNVNALVAKAKTAAGLRKLLSHRDSTVRRGAVLALRRMRGDQAMQVTIAEMNHPDAFVRTNLVPILRILSRPTRTLCRRTSSSTRLYPAVPFSTKTAASSPFRHCQTDLNLDTSLASQKPGWGKPFRRRNNSSAQALLPTT